MKRLFTGRRRWLSISVTAGVTLLVLALATWAVAGKDIRVWLLLRDLPDDQDARIEAIRRLDLPYKAALSRALLRGGLAFPIQRDLTQAVLGEPFYDRPAVTKALGNGDPVVRRAAALAFILRDATAPPSALPDPIFTILSEWAKEIHSPWLEDALADLGLYRDPRLPSILLPLVTARSETGVTGAGTEGLLEVGRANRNRGQAVRLLRAYMQSAEVVDALKEIVKREKDSDEVQVETWKSLTGPGFSGDPEVFWIAAKSKQVFVRQVVANNLEWVRDPRVVPILLYLADDENEVARRGAVSSLMAKRAPEVLDNMLYWAEDSYDPIRGDLATAVDAYRAEDLIPFVAFCLTDEDPLVVEKALVSLFRLTKKHFGFEDVWQNYLWDRPLMGGEQGNARSGIVKAFMADAARKAKALDAWAADYPPRYGDEQRLPHLVRQLSHRDSRNVRRAIRELARITKRTDGFPPEVLDEKADAQAESDAVYRFMHGGRDAVIADWQRWLTERK